MNLMITASALWMGVLTSISPCPMATNIAAISYIGRRVDKSGAAFWTGMLYAAGRTIAYVMLAVLLLNSLFSVPLVSMWLQEYMNKLIGPVLIFAGIFLLGFLNINMGGLSDRLNNWLKIKADNSGMAGALILGFFFALSFCPVSAALFFGSLIPMALKHQSSFILPLIYGAGTALPVLVCGLLLALGGSKLGQTFNRITEFEVWARRITSVLFIGIGIYFTITYLFEITI